MVSAAAGSAKPSRITPSSGDNVHGPTKSTCAAPATPSIPSSSSSANTNTGTSATAISAAASSGRIVRKAAIRHRLRSLSRSNVRRRAPSPLRTRPGYAGTCVSSQRFAARRSSRASARHAPAPATTSGSPMPRTLSAAPITSSATAGHASSVTGRLTTRYATACPARRSR